MSARAAWTRPLLQLTLLRFRALYREPSVAFWSFLFPLLTSIALGIAFRNRPPQEVALAVVGPEAATLAARMDAMEGVAATAFDEASATDALRRGSVSAIVTSSAPHELRVDRDNSASLAGRLIARDALERALGREDRLQVRVTESAVIGARYVDFLIPGLLGVNLLFSAAWGLGWSVVEMRKGKLLKRLGATPMRRIHFLASFAISRAALLAVEVLFFLAFARLLFDVRMQGSYLTFFAFSFLGLFAFAGISLAIVARVENAQTANGLMNVLTMPMLLLSGVFFAATNFPAWSQPIIQALPLTALLDALRGVMTDGRAAAQLWAEALLLLAWGTGGTWLALRTFRWS